MMLLTVMLWLHVTLRRRPPEIILVQYAETCLKSFQSYFTGLFRLMNIFQDVRCRRNNFTTPSAAEIILFQFQTWLHAK